MFNKIKYISLLLIFPASLALAAGKEIDEDADAKVVSGMSIVGNNETPKSLVIVPWKSSEIIQESRINSDLFSDNMEPVDKEAFMRNLELYKLNHPDQ